MKIFTSEEDLISFYFNTTDKNKIKKYIQKINNLKINNLENNIYDRYYNDDNDDNDDYVYEYTGIYKLMSIIKYNKKYRLMFAYYILDNEVGTSYFVCRNNYIFFIEDIFIFNKKCVFNKNYEILFFDKNKDLYKFNEIYDFSAFNDPKILKTKKEAVNSIKDVFRKKLQPYKDKCDKIMKNMEEQIDYCNDIFVDSNLDLKV